MEISYSAKNYIKGNPEHNNKQPLQSIDLTFESQHDRDLFVQTIEARIGKNSIIKIGAKKPTLQISPQALAHFNGIGDAQDIPFEQKPAQQVLNELGVKADPKAPLSQTTDNKPLKKDGNNDVVIKSFTSPVGTPEEASLTLTGARIDRLLKSAKTYVNTDIFPSGQYKKTMKKGTLSAQDKSQSREAKTHWQNLAVGVCHVQEIDLLTTQHLLDNGKAVNTPRTGVIKADDPALLLVSSPALNFNYGVASHLSKDERKEFIAGMYRNLFNATLNEGRNYIAMPAAGLGVFGGDPELYFTTLMQVAKEFPELNIIYNPAKYGKEFDTALAKLIPTNVTNTNRDVLLVANELTQQGHLCAFHNPSDSDVVYGVYDVGEYWKNGYASGYVGEEHVGAMTTAALNSRLLNPQAYSTVIENRLTRLPTKLSEEQVMDIRLLRRSLEKELQSSWPYPNKARKAEKIEALNALLEYAEDFSLEEAIEHVKFEYPQAIEGTVSTRTSSLFKAIVDSVPKDQLWMM